MSAETDKLDQVTTRLQNIAGTLGTDITNTVAALALSSNKSNGSVTLSADDVKDFNDKLAQLGAVGDTLTSLHGQLTSTGTLPGTVTSPVTGSTVNTDTGASASGAAAGDTTQANANGTTATANGTAAAATGGATS